MISQKVYIGNLKKMEPKLVNSLQNKTPFNKSFQSLEQIILSHFLGSPKALQWRHNERYGSQITSLSSVCSNICSSADQRKQQSSASLAFVGGIHQWLVDPLTKGQKPGKCFHLMTSSWTQNHLVPTWCSLHWLCKTNCMWCNGSWHFKCNWTVVTRPNRMVRTANIIQKIRETSKRLALYCISLLWTDFCLYPSGFRHCAIIRPPWLR